MYTQLKTAIFCSIFFVGCDSTPEEKIQGVELGAVGATPTAAPADAPQAAIDVDAYYSQTCAVCHGAEGKGDGPGAAAMDPKPRDYSDAEWQESVTDDDLKKVIVGGGMALGKSPLMPGTPDLKTKPELLDALVKKVRGYKK